MLQPRQRAGPLGPRRAASMLAARHGKPRPVRASAASGEAGGLRFRRGTWADAPVIVKNVISESMNPLVGDPSSFTIAEKGGVLVGFGRIKPLQGGATELASLTVLPTHRGAGIGSALVAELVARAPRQDTIYLTTIGRRVALYERQGFLEVPKSEIPGALRFEATMGSIVAKLAVDDRLVVMRRPAGSQ